MASAIASTKVMKAQQVVKSESGEEVKALFSLLSAWLSTIPWGWQMASISGQIAAEYVGVWQSQIILVFLG